MPLAARMLDTACKNLIFLKNTFSYERRNLNNQKKLDQFSYQLLNVICRGICRKRIQESLKQ